MGWIYDIEYTNENGHPITVSVGIKDPKKVPGALVHWIDTRGDFHHEYVPIYVKGELKNRPKSTVHGCLDKNRQPLLKIGKAAASELVSKYNSALRKYKKNSDNYDDLKGKSGKDLSAAIRKKANDYAIQQTVKYTKEHKGLVDKWRTSELDTFLNKKHEYDAKVDQGLNYLKENPDKLKNTDLTMEYMEKHAKRMKNRFVNKAARDINEDINKKAFELRTSPNAGIYIDKHGHMRMGILDVKMSDAMKKKMKSRRNKNGAKLRAYNVQKLNGEKRRKPTIRKASKKYLAEIDAEYAAEAKERAEAKKNFVASKSWGSMTNEEKINHAKKVLNLENPTAMTSFKNSKMRNRDKNNAILQKYDTLSDEVKNKHLP